MDRLNLLMAFAGLPMFDKDGNLILPDKIDDTPKPKDIYAYKSSPEYLEA